MTFQLDNALVVVRHSRTHISINGEELKRERYSTSRSVYRYHDLLLKLDGDQNHGQVLSEVLLWNDVEEKDKKFFVPLVGAGLTVGGEMWLAQPFCTSDSDVQKRGDDLRDVMDKYGLTDIYPDYLGHNWMWIDGVPRIFDWGFNRYSYQVTAAFGCGKIPVIRWGADEA